MQARTEGKGRGKGKKERMRMIGAALAMTILHVNERTYAIDCSRLTLAIPTLGTSASRRDLSI